MEIDRSAPVQASCEIFIPANAEAIWDVLVDVAAWPEWNPLIAAAELPGGATVGNTIHWEANDWQIASTIIAADALRELSWQGANEGEAISGIHVWRIEPDGAGCRVLQEESFAADLLADEVAGMRQQLQQFLEHWSQRLHCRVTTSGRP